jgi:lipoyl(octanoyl) transferase
MPPKIWVVPLGRTGYDACHALQQRVFDAKIAPLKAARMARRDAVAADHRPDVVFTTEHANDAFTMGRRDTSDGFRDPKLRALMAKAEKRQLVGDTAAVVAALREPAPTVCRQISRGGGLTWHGVGQATVYPIVAFKRWWQLQPAAIRGPSPLHWVTDQLEHSMVAVAGDVGAGAAHTSKVGVWLKQEGALDGEAKVGFVGLAAADFVSMHGCSMNVTCDNAAFDRIEMCELPGKVPTTLAAHAGPSVTVADVSGRIAERFVQRLVLPAPDAAMEAHAEVTIFGSTESGLDAVLSMFPIRP